MARRLTGVCFGREPCETVGRVVCAMRRLLQLHEQQQRVREACLQVNTIPTSSQPIVSCAGVRTTVGL